MKWIIRVLMIGCCLMTNVAVNAQGLIRTTVLEKTVEVTVFKKGYFSQSFVAGDTVIITIQEEHGKNLSKVLIEDVNSPFKRLAQNVTNMEERLIVTTDTDFNFTFQQKLRLKNPFPLKRKLKIKIEKEQFVMPEIVAVNDFVETETVTIQHKTYELKQSDTTFSRIMEEAVYLGSTIEPGSKTRKIFPITPVPGTTYYVYWIGVGKPTMLDYQTLQTKMPLTWSAEGVLEPIDAFALGKINQLPTGIHGEDVLFAITNETNKNAFLKGKPFSAKLKRKGIVAYGYIDAAYVPESEASFICLNNDNEVSGINVYLKILAVNIKQEFEEIIKEEVITTNKVFRLNTEAMSINEAKIAIRKTEKELEAAFERTVKEFDAAQRSLDSTKVARFKELEQAQANLDIAYLEVQQKETYVNNLLIEQIEEKIKGLEQNSSNSTDSMAIVAMQLELKQVLEALEVARKELKEVEQQRKTVSDLLQKDLKSTVLKSTDKVIDGTGQDASSLIKQKTDGIIKQAVEETKEIINKQVEDQ